MIMRTIISHFAVNANLFCRFRKIRKALMNFIRGPVLQLIMSFLVLVDALIVTAEIILEIHAVKGISLSFHRPP